MVGKTTLYDMEVDHSQRHILTACQDRNIRVYNVSNGKHSKTFKGSIADDGTLIKVGVRVRRSVPSVAADGRHRVARTTLTYGTSRVVRTCGDMIPHAMFCNSLCIGACASLFIFPVSQFQSHFRNQSVSSLMLFIFVSASFILIIIIV